MLAFPEDSDTKPSTVKEKKKRKEKKETEKKKKKNPLKQMNAQNTNVRVSVTSRKHSTRKNRKSVDTDTHP